MSSTLIDQYRRWFEYEKDSHRKVLESLETVPDESRASEPYQKALNLMGHLLAARRIWLHRIEPSYERPAAIFPTGVKKESLPAGASTSPARDGSGPRRLGLRARPEDEVGDRRLAAGRPHQRGDLAAVVVRMAVELGQDVG